MSSELHSILAPSSIAIVGASKDPTKRGNQALRALLRDGFAGRIFPVHPKESEILGIRTYPSVVDVEEAIDLALICTPAKTLPTILEQCGQKSVKGAIVLGAGFSEAGEAGRQLEQQAIHVARKNGIRIIGPNTSGVFNLHRKLDLVGYSGLRPGGVGIVSQSGNMALSLVTEATINGHIGFSTYVGVGNQADIRFSEYLEYFADDVDTQVPVLYVEGFKNGRRFLDVARAATQKKPVVVYKSGRTAAGQLAASSHTGALAGSFDLTVGVLRQAGVTVVRESDKLLPVAETLSLLPTPKGDRVAVLADGGGHATIATDALVEAGLALASLNADTRGKLAQFLPPAASLANPIDVAGGTDDNPGVFADCANLLLQDDGVDALLIVGLFGGYGIRFSETLKAAEAETGLRLGALLHRHGKPMILQSLYAPMKPEPLQAVRKAGVPVYGSIETAVHCLAASIDYMRAKNRNGESAAFDPNAESPEARRIVANAIAAGRQSLFEFEAKDLLSTYGVRVPPQAVIRSEGDIPGIAKSFGDEPVAMKIVSKDILHKSDAGGVKLKVMGEPALREGFRSILANAQAYNPAADIEGILVAPMAKSGVEVIIGVVQDAIFGPVMMFGLGGIFVEVLKDVVFRAVPLSRSDAEEMLEQITSSKILDGVRGNPPVNRSALVDLMLKVSTVVQAHPEIAEIDLNPVIVRDDGYDVVDARMVLSSPAE